MNAVAFDTHAVVKELIAAGFTDEQAEAVTRAVSQAQAVDLHDLATKADLTGLKSDMAILKSDMAVLRSDMAVLRSDLQADMAVLRSDVQRDMAVLRSDVQRDMAVLRSDLQAGLAAAKVDLATTAARLEKLIGDTRTDLLRWIVGAIGLQTAAVIGTVVALVRLIPH